MSKRVVIVGGGIIGLCTAYYGAKLGLRVTLIDRLPEHRDGCSFGNAGMIVPSHFVPLAAPGMVAMGLKWMWNPESPFYIKPRWDWDLAKWGYLFWRAATKARVDRAAPILRDLSLASSTCFGELALELPMEFGLTRHGLLMLCKTQRVLDEEAKYADHANRLGVPANVLDAAATAALDPDVSMNVAGSVYFPKDSHLSPNSLMLALKSQCMAMGVDFQWQTEVSEIDRNQDRIQRIRTTSGDFEADEIVLCGGSWSPLLAKAIGLKLPMQAGKGYSVTLNKPRQLPRLCAIFTEARVAVTPMGQSLRFGGTMEIAGLIETINARRVQGIIRSIPSYYPEFQMSDFANTTPWHGLRPCSPDGMPYIGRTKRIKNLTIATGHAMMGLSLGPITGKMVIEILCDQTPTIPLDLLSPDRYG